MSLQELETAVQQLPEEEYAAFIAWLSEQKQVNFGGEQHRTGVAATEAAREAEPLPGQRPPAGLYRGQVNLPDDFDAPLPDDILQAFEDA